MVDRTPPPEPPRTVRAVVALLYAGAALTLLVVVVVLFPSGETDEGLELEVESVLSGSTLDPDAVLRVGVPVGVLYALVVLALWVWLARANGRGRQWARVTATVLGGLALVLHPVAMATGGAGEIVVRLGLLVHAVAIVVLLWLPRSSRYYDAVSETRSPGQWLARP